MEQNKVRTLSSHKELETARQAWASVYTTKDPFHFPFPPSWLATVFNRTSGYYLREDQFDAMMNTAAALDEEEILVVQRLQVRP